MGDAISPSFLELVLDVAILCQRHAVGRDRRSSHIADESLELIAAMPGDGDGSMKAEAVQISAQMACQLWEFTFIAETRPDEADALTFLSPSAIRCLTEADMQEA